MVELEQLRQQLWRLCEEAEQIERHLKDWQNKKTIVDQRRGRIEGRIEQLLEIYNAEEAALGRKE